MTSPTARALALLELLQHGGTHPAGDLARRLGVDERTVRRYVDHLRDLDVPVDAVRGRYGGFRLGSGYRVPPLMLTGDEAVAVLLGALVADRAGLLPTERAAAEAATAKLRRVLPDALRERVDRLLDTAAFTDVDRPGTAVPTGVLLTVATAAGEHRALRFRYTRRDGATSAERVVLPHGLVVHRGRWYLGGRDTGTDEVRTFRLDRMAGVVASRETSTEPSATDPAADVLSALAATPWHHEVTVRVAAPADDVRARLHVAGAVVDPGPGGCRVRFRAERLDWVPRVLAGLGGDVVVESPAELRDVLRAEAARFAAWADATPG